MRIIEHFKKFIGRSTDPDFTTWNVSQGRYLHVYWGIWNSSLYKLPVMERVALGYDISPTTVAISDCLDLEPMDDANLLYTISNTLSDLNKDKKSMPKKRAIGICLPGLEKTLTEDEIKKLTDFRRFAQQYPRIFSCTGGNLAIKNSNLNSHPYGFKLTDEKIEEVNVYKISRRKRLH